MQSKEPVLLLITCLCSTCHLSTRPRGACPDSRGSTDCLVTTNSAAGNNMCLLSHSLHGSGVQAQCNWCSAQGLIKLKSRHQSNLISFETRILSPAFKFSKLSKNSVPCDCRTEVPFPYWLSVGHHSQLLEAI